MNEKYLSIKTRNARFKELKAQGKSVYRSSIRGCQIHPQYVRDYVGEEKYETGFGNTVYKTYFPVLYTIEIMN